jgi:hypothetical protein
LAFREQANDGPIVSWRSHRPETLFGFSAVVAVGHALRLRDVVHKTLEVREISVASNAHLHHEKGAFPFPTTREQRKTAHQCYC